MNGALSQRALRPSTAKERIIADNSGSISEIQSVRLRANLIDPSKIIIPHGKLI